MKCTSFLWSHELIPELIKKRLERSSEAKIDFHKDLGTTLNGSKDSAFASHHDIMSKVCKLFLPY